jgi:hypothetical protein
MSDMRLAEFDIAQIPVAEDDEFEFKSSQTPENTLKDKLNKAASGFSNSGGGFFIVGIDNGSGDVDGGIPRKMGKQDLRDWVDNVIHNTQPLPKYKVTLLDDIRGRGNLNNDSVVLVVYFHESYIGPHMAHDNRYYIRAGAHTVPAKHFIVDAIWAKRHFSKPRLTHLFRLKPDKPSVIQLGILALTNSAAIDVEINLLPMPPILNDCAEVFPLKVSLIDQENSFFFDVSIYTAGKEHFGDGIQLTVKYSDLNGRAYSYQSTLDIMGTVPPKNIGSDYLEKISNSLNLIQQDLSKLLISDEAVPISVHLLNPPALEAIEDIERLLPELFNGFRQDLKGFPLIREFILMNKGAEYLGTPNKEIVAYYYEDHSHLRSKLRILENHALIREITFNNTSRFLMTESLVTYLLSSPGVSE